MTARVLFVNPNKWGRGITTIWVASHSGVLKKNDIKTKLFDATFYKSWTDNELKINTENKQFKLTDYENQVIFKENNIFQDLQACVDSFNPDIIFFSAITSHIHGEGEYINVDYSYELIKKNETKALIICGGIKATHNHVELLKKYKKINFVISGESEKILLLICKNYKDLKKIEEMNGVSYRQKDGYKRNRPQKIITDMDDISPYDYDIYEDQIFVRPYNGKVVRAVDYEISRGCIYSCSYCVETIIQRYYGFDEINQSSGSIKQYKNYLRNKSADTIFKEIYNLNKNKKITLFRLQDTNFLTINRKVLTELSELIHNSKLDIKLYIETRAEGINEKSIELLKKLKVDGVGMGLELSDETYRTEYLNRFINQDKIVGAFKLLKDANINRTAYNIIGLPNQTEESIVKTLEFNNQIKPDTSIAAYYSIYSGTKLENKAKGEFDKMNLYDMDPQIRSKSIKHNIPINILDFYKNNFSYFVKNGLDNLKEMKTKYLNNQ